MLHFPYGPNSISTVAMPTGRMAHDAFVPASARGLNPAGQSANPATDTAVLKAEMYLRVCPVRTNGDGLGVNGKRLRVVA